MICEKNGLCDAGGLVENVDLFLEGKHPGTKESYGYFLKDFMALLCAEYGWETPDDLRIDETVSRFERYCKEKNYKETTARSRRYGLRSYLSFLNIEIGPYDLLSKPWEESIDVIPKPTFDSFIGAIRKVCKRGEEDEIVLIACLAYYCGLSLNEILKLSAASFYRSGSHWCVHVTGVSRKEKDRVVNVPEEMTAELSHVLSRNPAPLFTLGRKEDASAGFTAKKLKLQRTIAKAAECMEKKNGAPDRYDLKALRSSRIYEEIMAGRERKDIMKTYGVSEYYISHILKEKEYA